MDKLAEADRAFLLQLARSTIAAELNKGNPVHRPDPLPPALE